MKVNRSTKCSLSESTFKKQSTLKQILSEYRQVVNFFIDYFWKNGRVRKNELFKEIVDLPNTWLSARLRKVAAREALDMVSSVQEVFESNKQQLESSIRSIKSALKKLEPITKQDRRKINNLSCLLKKKEMRLSMIQPRKPKHKGQRMAVSCTIAELQEVKSADGFDAWLHLTSIGNKVILDLPIKFHDHYNELAFRGKRLNSYVITPNYVQFCFEIETGPKKEVKKVLGVDTGINALAATSDGELLGTDIKALIEKKKRCRYGSKRHQRTSRALKQRICEVAKEIVSKTDLLVVEKLKNMNKNSKLKGRLSGNMRSSIGSWLYSFWLDRLQMDCEDSRTIYRSVVPYNTSIECPDCHHADRRNRCGTKFQCRKCDRAGNADCVAAWNIVMRFLTGPYGACYRPLKPTCNFL